MRRFSVKRMSRLVLVFSMIMFLTIDTTRAGVLFNRWRSLRCERPACVVIDTSCCVSVPTCCPPSPCPPIDCCSSSDSISVDCCSSDQVVVEHDSSHSKNTPTPADSHDEPEADDDMGNAEDSLEVPNDAADPDVMDDPLDTPPVETGSDDASASPNDVSDAEEDAFAEPVIDDATDVEDTTDADSNDLFDDSPAITEDANDDLFSDEPANDDAADLFDDTTTTDEPADAADDDLFSDPPADDATDSDVDLFDNADDDSAAADDEPRVADNVDDLFNDADDAATTDDADAGLDDLFDEVEDGATDEADESLDSLFDDSSSLQTPNAFRTAKVSKQASNKPTNRLWTDNTGHFQTLGRLVEVREREIRIFKENGRFSTVPKTRLSPIDLKYVNKMASQLSQSTWEVSVQH